MAEDAVTLRTISKKDDIETHKILTDYCSMLESIRLDYEPLWQDVIDYLAYDRYNFKQDQQKGQKANTLIYDGSPLSAWRILVNGTEGNLLRNPEGGSLILYQTG